MHALILLQLTLKYRVYKGGVYPQPWDTKSTEYLRARFTLCHGTDTGYIRVGFNGTLAEIQGI